MAVISNETLLQQLKWRYATKQFDPTRKISAEDWKALEESIVLTPASFGLPTWRAYVIADPAVRAKLQPASWGQSQVVDASHVVVFAVKREITAADIDQFIALVASERGTAKESLKGYADVITGFVSKLGTEGARVWAAKQTYIALGQLMTSAALLGIDTCPMEGLDPKAYDDILGLEKQGYATAVVATLGYRKDSDKYATLKKVRPAKQDVILTV